LKRIIARRSRPKPNAHPFLEKGEDGKEGKRKAVEEGGEWEREEGKEKGRRRRRRGTWGEDRSS